jgi:isopentenyl diphosphate isomerase/L-lactate dehydrogenase-like FMN-dependent dehydrogenase
MKRAQETAASITKNAEGDRNYKPVANAVKPVANNAPVKTITKETVKNVPKEIRPKK